MMIMLTMWLLLALIINAGNSQAFSPTVKILCAESHIRVIAVFNSPYNGLMHSRSAVPTAAAADSRNSRCATTGVGDFTAILLIPLIAPGNRTCGVVQKENAHSVVVDIRQYDLIESSSDRSFLVQCSKATSLTPLINKNKHDGTIEKYSLENNGTGRSLSAVRFYQYGTPVRRAAIGDIYQIRVKLPSAVTHRVGSCVAFGGVQHIRYAPLTDNFGCPLNQSAMSIFENDKQQNEAVATLRMFRFNESHQIHFQCAIEKCHGACKMQACSFENHKSRPENDIPIFQPQIALQGQESVLTASALHVQDVPTRVIRKTQGCNFFAEPKLILLTLLLVTLIGFFILSCSLAVKNCPYKLVLTPDGSASFKHRRCSFASSTTHLKTASIGSGTSIRRRKAKHGANIKTLPSEISKQAEGNKPNQMLHIYVPKIPNDMSSKTGTNSRSKSAMNYANRQSRTLDKRQTPSVITANTILTYVTNGSNKTLKISKSELKKHIRQPEFITNTSVVNDGRMTKSRNEQVNNTDTENYQSFLDFHSINGHQASRQWPINNCSQESAMSSSSTPFSDDQSTKFLIPCKARVQSNSGNNSYPTMFSTLPAKSKSIEALNPYKISEIYGKAGRIYGQTGRQSIYGNRDATVDVSNSRLSLLANTNQHNLSKERDDDSRNNLVRQSTRSRSLELLNDLRLGNVEILGTKLPNGDQDRISRYRNNSPQYEDDFSVWTDSDASTIQSVLTCSTTPSINAEIYSRRFIRAKRALEPFGVRKSMKSIQKLIGPNSFRRSISLGRNVEAAAAADNTPFVDQFGSKSGRGSAKVKTKLPPPYRSKSSMNLSENNYNPSCQPEDLIVPSAIYKKIAIENNSSYAGGESISIYHRQVHHTNDATVYGDLNSTKSQQHNYIHRQNQPRKSNKSILRQNLQKMSNNSLPPSADSIYSAQLLASAQLYSKMAKGSKQRSSGKSISTNPKNVNSNLQGDAIRSRQAHRRASMKSRRGGNLNQSVKSRKSYTKPKQPTIEELDETFASAEIPNTVSSVIDRKVCKTDAVKTEQTTKTRAKNEDNAEVVVKPEMVCKGTAAPSPLSTLSNHSSQNGSNLFKKYPETRAIYYDNCYQSRSSQTNPEKNCSTQTLTDVGSGWDNQAAAEECNTVTSGTSPIQNHSDDTNAIQLDANTRPDKDKEADVDNQSTYMKTPESTNGKSDNVINTPTKQGRRQSYSDENPYSNIENLHTSTICTPSCNEFVTCLEQNLFSSSHAGDGGNDVSILYDAQLSDPNHADKITAQPQMNEPIYFTLGESRYENPGPIARPNIESVSEFDRYGETVLRDNVANMLPVGPVLNDANHRNVQPVPNVIPVRSPPFAFNNPSSDDEIFRSVKKVVLRNANRDENSIMSDETNSKKTVPLPPRYVIAKNANISNILLGAIPYGSQHRSSVAATTAMFSTAGSHLMLPNNLTTEASMDNIGMSSLDVNLLAMQSTDQQNLPNTRISCVSGPSEVQLPQRTRADTTAGRIKSMLAGTKAFFWQ